MGENFQSHACQVEAQPTSRGGTFELEDSVSSEGPDASTLPPAKLLVDECRRSFGIVAPSETYRESTTVMRFIGFQKPMFRVALEAAPDEQSRLIEYLRWLRLEHVPDRLRDHALGPSSLWSGWSAETYLGFSGERILLQSGHRFGTAELVPSRWAWLGDRFNVGREMRAFRSVYPHFLIPPAHQRLFEAHPGAYLRAAEAFLISPKQTAQRMIEIGAGNCTWPIAIYSTPICARPSLTCRSLSLLATCCCGSWGSTSRYRMRTETHL